MYCKKNVKQSLLGFILGEKDTVGICRDMEEIGDTRSHNTARDPRKQHTLELHLRPLGNIDRFFKPHDPCALLVNDEGRFINLISSIKIPTGYAGHWPSTLDRND